MFAVPGWSISKSQLKAQAQQASHKDQKHDQDGNAVETAQKSNKRKRGGEKDGKKVKVTRSNLDEMWRTHIEGQPSSTAVERSSGAKEQRVRKKKKNQKTGTGTGERKEDFVSKEDDAVRGGKESQLAVSSAAPGKANGKHKPKKNRMQNDTQEPHISSTDASAAPLANNLPPPPPSTSASLTPLQLSMRQKLLSARFRHLNETLYTAPSTQAMELFSTNPELFNEYHAGFSQQVKDWPSNPVDGYVQAVKTRGRIKPSPKGQAKYGKQNPSRPGALEPLPRRPHGTCTIADLGCGDAQFAHALSPSSSRNSLNLKLLNFDLSESDPLITKADISNLPVEDGSVDVAIFCLSLMGTNWIAFVEEAWRALRGDGKGECWVSEVKSRFGKVGRKQQKGAHGEAATQGKKDKGKKKKRKTADDEEDAEDVGQEIFAEDTRLPAANDADETDISAFVEVFRTRGFSLKQDSVDKSNKMFVKMEFVKPRGPAPTRGKHAKTGDSSFQAGKFGKKKFLERDDAGSGLTLDEETKVLKPCVYKTR